LIDAAPVVVPLAPPVPAAAVPAQASAEGVDVESQTYAMLRVRADIVDRLVNEAGEVAIARARIEGELRSIKSNLLELTNSVIRLRGQVREIELQAETQIQSRMSAASVHHEFDPLELDRFTRFQELTRSLAEGVNDVSTVQQALLRNLDDADAALLAQARLSRDVQQRLFAIRTVPSAVFRNGCTGSCAGRRRSSTSGRTWKSTAGKPSSTARCWKSWWPARALLRNALDHGIEARADRVQAGKPETGEISLTVRQVGNEVAIELADDGAGIDYANVRNRARSLGLIAPTRADRAAIDRVPVPARILDRVEGHADLRPRHRHGRGAREIAALGGRVEVRSAPGKGTQFNLFFPLTLAVAQAVLVRAGGRLWALPAPMVEQVQQVKSETLVDLYVSRKVDWQDASTRSTTCRASWATRSTSRRRSASTPCCY